MSEHDSAIMTILTFEDKTGNRDLDSQLDQTATLMFDRVTKPVSIEEITAELQKGIYGED